MKKADKAPTAVIDTETLLRLLLSSPVPEPDAPKYNTYKPGRFKAFFGAKFLRGVHGNEKSGDWFKKCFLEHKDYALSVSGVKYIFKQYNWPLPPDDMIENLVEEALAAKAPLVTVIPRPDPPAQEEEEEVEEISQPPPPSNEQLALDAVKRTIIETIQEELRHNSQLSQFTEDLKQDLSQLKEDWSQIKQDLVVAAQQQQQREDVVIYDTPEITLPPSDDPLTDWQRPFTPSVNNLLNNSPQTQAFDEEETRVDHQPLKEEEAEDSEELLPSSPPPLARRRTPSPLPPPPPPQQQRRTAKQKRREVVEEEEEEEQEENVRPVKRSKTVRRNADDDDDGIIRDVQCFPAALKIKLGKNKTQNMTILSYFCKGEHYYRSGHLLKLSAMGGINDRTMRGYLMDDNKDGMEALTGREQLSIFREADRAVALEGDVMPFSNKSANSCNIYTVRYMRRVLLKNLKGTQDKRFWHDVFHQLEEHEQNVEIN